MDAAYEFGIIVANNFDPHYPNDAYFAIIKEGELKTMARGEFNKLLVDLGKAGWCIAVMLPEKHLRYGNGILMQRSVRIHGERDA